jgi:YVTN family beta-propeller protein
MKNIYIFYPLKVNTLKTALGITALALLMLVSIAGASPFAYITNEDSKNVSIIDLSANRVVSSISVGSDPVGVAVSPGGRGFTSGMQIATASR